MTAKEQVRLLDAVGRRILEELQRDARLSYAELGRRVHLSTPAVAERVRRMEEAGIITGYHAAVNPAALGLPIRAIIRVRASLRSYDQVRRAVTEFPEVIEAHHLTGADDLLLTVLVCSVDHLESVLDRLRPLGDHVTSLVLSSPVERRPIVPREDFCPD
ncbi:MAG TPA: Lrp/AsnC family transcriptional regulator [Thermomicrobiales bacterium]|nr:Lrp/AsnC family transcriptional regulator [Thermomicrobiales bacterium]